MCSSDAVDAWEMEVRLRVNIRLLLQGFITKIKLNTSYLFGIISDHLFWIPIAHNQKVGGFPPITSETSQPPMQVDSSGRVGQHEVGWW